MKLLLQFVVMLVLLCSFIPTSHKTKTGSISISFFNTVNGKYISDREEYTNPFNEKYSISKLTYYISNVAVLSNDNKTVTEKNSYRLIKGLGEDFRIISKDFSFKVPAGTYQSISFLIGVDSSKNVSGAQTNALDPTHGMFWAWNTGYVMFKVEGTSPQSTIADTRFEYHIGGFRGSNHVLRRVELPLSSLQIKRGCHISISIEADINKLWQSTHDIKITEIPSCTTEGIMASKIADNFSNIFSIRSISNQ